MENIDEIRRNAIIEIKEKVKKNPKYYHPVNKERQEDMKRLKLANGNDFTYWMQQNGIMKSSADINRKEMKKAIKNAGYKTQKEYQDKCAQNAGFINNSDRYRDYAGERRHE